MLLVLAALVAACGTQENKNYPFITKYLPVVLQGSEKWSILNTESGEVLARDAFDKAPSAIVCDLFYVQNKQGTFDYYNVADLKHPVNKTHFGSCTEFSPDGFAVAAEKGKKLAVIDKNCQVVKELPDSVMECTNFTRGMAVITCDNGKQGYINTQGEVVVPAKYSQVYPFVYDDNALVMSPQDGQQQVAELTIIDKTGKELFSTNTTVMVPNPNQPYFKGGALQVKRAKGDTVVCINSEGREVANPYQVPDTIKKAGFDGGGFEGSGNYIVVQNQKMGVLDAQGKTVIPVKYDDIIDLSPTRFLLGDKNGVYTLTDKQGNPVGKAKIVHANGTPGSKAQRGYVDVATMGGNLLSLFDESHIQGIPKGATVKVLYDLFDGAHPEQYAGNNTLAQNVGPIMSFLNFAGPIVSKDAAGNFNFNMATPLRMVVLNIDCNAYGNDTEPQLFEFISGNMGKTGFIAQGKGVFTSSTQSGTAVAIGYEGGTFSVQYFMNVADARPLPQKPREN